MASVNRKSLSLTDVARFKRKFNDYGFAEHMKKEQSYMLTPFDLSECVGPVDTPYPKPPLGSQPGSSLLEPSWSSSQRGKSFNTHNLRKALSGTRIPCRKIYLRNGKQELDGKQEKFACKSNANHMPKTNVTGQKKKRSRIPVPIVKARASRSTNETKEATKEKPATKRHFSLLTLGRKMQPSKIPVRIDKVSKETKTLFYKLSWMELWSSQICFFLSLTFVSLRNSAMKDDPSCDKVNIFPVCILPFFL